MTVEEIRDQMKKTWVKKSGSDEGNKPIPEATSRNPSGNFSKN